MGEKAVLSGNLSCYISETEGRRKLKRGKGILQIRQICSRENRGKKHRHECPFKKTLFNFTYIVLCHLTKLNLYYIGNKIKTIAIK